MILVLVMLKGLSLPSVLSGLSCLSKHVCLHGWTLRAPYAETLSTTPSMTTFFKHTFYRCRSGHGEPLLLLIYISIKQYEDNGFIAVVALGQKAERATADSDRGDWWGTAMKLNQSFNILKWWVCAMRLIDFLDFRSFLLPVWGILYAEKCLSDVWFIH